MTPTFVDTVAPVATIRRAGERRDRGDPVGDGRWRRSTRRCRTCRAPPCGCATSSLNQIVPASVTYDSATREVRLRPAVTADWSPRLPARARRRDHGSCGEPAGTQPGRLHHEQLRVQGHPGNAIRGRDPVDRGPTHRSGLRLRTVLPDGQGQPDGHRGCPRPRARPPGNRPRTPSPMTTGRVTRVRSTASRRPG